MERTQSFGPAAAREIPVAKYLTEKELEDYVKISSASIRRLVRDEAIPYIVIPLGAGGRRTIRFKAAAIDRWMAALERRPLRRGRVKQMTPGGLNGAI